MCFVDLQFCGILSTPLPDHSHRQRGVFDAVQRDTIQNVGLIFQPGAFDPTATTGLDLSYFQQWLPRLSSTSDLYAGATPPEGEYTLIVFHEDLSWLPGSLGYVLTLNGVVVGWGPSTEEQLDELKSTLSQNSRNSVQVVSSNIRGASQNSLATRNLTLSTKDEAAALMGNVYAWLKASTLYSRGSGRSYRGPLLQFGADVAVGENLVVGLSVGAGDISAKSTGFSFEGTQTLLQPYLGWQRGPWQGSASLVYGMVDYNTITTTLGTAEAEGEMLAFAAEISRDFVLDEKTTLAPFVALNTGQIELTATSGTLAGVGLGDKVNFTETSLGATMITDFDHGAFSFGLSADHFDTNAPTALSSGAFDSTGWSGSAQFGYSVNLSDRMVMDAGVEIGGIGSATTSYSGSVSFSMKF